MHTKTLKDLHKHLLLALHGLIRGHMRQYVRSIKFSIATIEKRQVKMFKSKFAKSIVHENKKLKVEIMHRGEEEASNFIATIKRRVYR